MRRSMAVQYSLGVGIGIAIAASSSQAWAADSKTSEWTGSVSQSTNGANPRFKLMLSSAATVTINLNSAGNAVDSYLYLYDASGNTLLASDDDSGGSYQSQIVKSLAPGEYQLIASTYSGTQRGAFTISTNQGYFQTCFIAYTDANYGGAADVFCAGGAGEPSLRNDQYSSYRIPKPRRVTVYEHGNFGGRKRTYFSDVPWVGPLWNDIVSSIQWNDFSVNDFFMTTMSDPQIEWSHCSEPNWGKCGQEQSTYPGYSTGQLSGMFNDRMVSALNLVGGTLGEDYVGGTIINGDLTDFGKQNGHLDSYISKYEHGVNKNVYLGLGNHDYANNVNDCSENTCAIGMVWYQKEQVWSLNPLRFDYSESGTYYSWPSYRKDHSGSLAYSWEIGNVHFVQLNNYPTYSTSFNGWNFSEARRDQFNISSAMSWLATDLSDAVARGKKIILNYHDHNDHWSSSSLSSILDSYPVTAVFAGHYHGSYGEQSAMYNQHSQPTRVFLSGSAHYGTFLVTRYVNNKMYVWMMQADPWNGGTLKVLYPNNSSPTTVTSSNMWSIFDTNPSNRYYQWVYDLR